MANIILKKGEDQFIFYRHSNGSPEDTLPVLEKLLLWTKDGYIADTLTQSAAWLIILGAIEAGNIPSGDQPPINSKAGTIEPCLYIYADINYLYTVDLELKSIVVEEDDLDVYWK